MTEDGKGDAAGRIEAIRTAWSGDPTGQSDEARAYEVTAAHDIRALLAEVGRLTRENEAYAKDAETCAALAKERSDALSEMGLLVERLTGERDEARDRAVCSGCGQDVDEGGACNTKGCDTGEMIPSSDLPGALRESMEARNELYAEYAAEVGRLSGLVVAARKVLAKEIRDLYGDHKLYLTDEQLKEKVDERLAAALAELREDGEGRSCICNPPGWLETRDEACLLHGREALPEFWQEDGEGK